MEVPIFMDSLCHRQNVSGYQLLMPALYRPGTYQKQLLALVAWSESTYLQGCRRSPQSFLRAEAKNDPVYTRISSKHHTLCLFRIWASSGILTLKTRLPKYQASKTFKAIHPIPNPSCPRGNPQVFHTYYIKDLKEPRNHYFQDQPWKFPDIFHHHALFGFVLYLAMDWTVFRGSST